MLKRVAGLLFTLLLSSAALAQSTFRGGISGVVEDPQDAIIAGANVEATSVTTGLVYKAISTSAGTFSIQDLPLGDYSVAVSFAGFTSVKVDAVRVSAGETFSLPVHMPLASTNTVVEVTASTLTLETTTPAKTFTMPKEEVQDIPINGRSFTNMANTVPGNTTGTTRYVIDGVDNNDVYSNSVGSNQGGVGGIPGTLLPIDSIEEFSAQTQSGAESGGYSGTTINVGIKSGTNRIHGTAYYFNRNEFFAVMPPFVKAANAVPGAVQAGHPAIRFQEYGGSVGGPILKDKMFYFINYERQQYFLGQGNQSQTEPSTAYVNRALALLASGGVTPASNPTITMMEKVITTLWQPNMLTGGAAIGNWTPPPSAAQHGYSNNLMMKFDQNINAKNKLSERWFYGLGKQTAPLSTSQNPWYYQVAGERVYNMAVTLNTQLSSRVVNQILMGVDFFNQPFTDQNPNNGAAATGFIVGLGPGDTYGQPGLAISGFDGTGGTSVQSRRDLSGHLTETLSLSLGKHQIRTGAEFRRIQIYAQATGRGSSSIYTRGTFSFSGTRGFAAPSGGNSTAPYPSSYDTQTKALADFLQGQVALSGNSPGAQLYNGSLDRNDSENNFNLYFQDSFQISRSLNLNFGMRWDYLSPAGDDQRDLSTFRAGTQANALAPTGGLAVVGSDISEPYKASSRQIAPRIGFAWQPSILPSITKGMVIRAGIGLYFDTPGLGTWLYATSLAGNPAGTRPLYNETLSGINIQPNAPIFPANAAASIPNNGAGGQCTGVKVATCPNLAIAGVDPNFSTGNTTNISASVQKSLGSTAIIEVSYVGERGRHLANSIDLNQTAYGATTNTTITNGFLNAQLQRPYFGPYPNFGKIIQTASFGASNANALQAYIRTRNWHGLISQLSYALSTSRGTGTIEDYNNPALDYGSNAVVTNQVKGYWTYNIPNFKSGPSWLVNKWVTGGWQVTGTLQFKGAAAVTASSSGACNALASAGTTYANTCSGLGLGEGAGRANLTSLPLFCPNGNCGGPLASGATSTSRDKIVNGKFIQWYNPYSVIAPPGCSAVADPNNTNGADCSKPLASYYGTTAPGQIHGAPGFSDVDLSVFKNFPISEKIKGQFRGEMYNVFNRVNLAKPSLAAGNTAADPRYGGLNVSSATGTGQITSTIGGTSAPGIAVGEPFNVQLAMKIIF